MITGIGVVSSPQSVNVSSGDHAVFNCTAIATFINWEVYGGPLDSNLISRGFKPQLTIELNVSQNLRMGSLRVLGSPDNDDVSIVCVALLQLPSFMFVANGSDPVLLLVQGIAINLVCVCSGVGRIFEMRGQIIKQT